jgi:ribosomal-protein-alanine N-acetyltransferase
MTDPITLRPATRRDRPFVGSLAAEAFATYGDYGPLLLDWLATPGVEGTIAEIAGKPVGLALLAFVADPGSRAHWVADVLAIAVAPEARRRGAGRRLIAAAVARAEQAARLGPVRALRLSGAEDNAAARALFEAAGFRYSGQEERFYPRGQRALHMRRPL